MTTPSTAQSELDSVLEKEGEQDTGVQQKSSTTPSKDKSVAGDLIEEVISAELRRSRAEEEEEAALSRALAASAEVLGPVMSPEHDTASNASEEQQEIDERSIYVGNVDYSTTEMELQLLFQSCGTIQRITILCDKFTGHPKGYAYIEFRDASAVEKAVTSMNDLTFKNRQLRVGQKRTNIPGLSARGNSTPFRSYRRPRRVGGPIRNRSPRGYHPY